MNDRELLSLDTDRLTAMTGEQAREMLVRVLDAFERSELSNYDHLILYGIRLASSSHNALDMATVDWAAEKPSLVRLDIVCTLLTGLWKHTISGVRVNGPALEGLMRVHEAVKPVDAEEYQYLLVVSEVSAGRVFRQLVRETL